MKSRYRKHLKRVEQNSPIIAFSKEEWLKGEKVRKEDLSLFDQFMGLGIEHSYSHQYKAIKQEIESSLILFTDHYLLMGNFPFIYLLVPFKNGTYKIIEKENIQSWKDAYWRKEDPNNERSWMYMDEDVDDLLDYILRSFNKNTKFHN